MKAAGDARLLPFEDTQGCHLPVSLPGKHGQAGVADSIGDAYFVSFWIDVDGAGVSDPRRHPALGGGDHAQWLDVAAGTARIDGDRVVGPVGDEHFVMNRIDEHAAWITQAGVFALNDPDRRDIPLRLL